MTETLVIDRRFRGPPTSANGGYACGAAGELVGSSASTTLWAPPPLDVALDVVRGEGGKVALRSGDALIAESAPAVLDGLEVPAPVDFDAATAASAAYPWYATHPFPMCFGCGPERPEGDALRIFPGAVAGRRIAAAPWIPHASFGDADGLVRAPVVWAALDCPSWFGMYVFEDWSGEALLGRLTACIVARPRVGTRCVAMGWFLGFEGRKIHCASAVHTAEGTLLASARATWVRLAAKPA